MKIRERPYATIVTLALAMLWVGLLIGVSFLATPAKFLAPNLPLPVALDIGRHTFGIFNKVEWLLALGVIVLTISSGDRVAMLSGIGAGFVVALETFWLLPILDQRAALIIAGQSPSATGHHSLYIWVEFGKLMMLAVVVVRTSIRIARALNEGRTDRERGLGPFPI
jgi:hypothetical protein